MEEKTVTMMEGVAREWRVRVMDSAGNVLNPEGFSFYGAAADGVQVPRRMQVRVEGDVVVLVLPGLWMSGRCWRYQVMCQDVLTGVEWVLCQGDVVLERRVACNGPALHEDAVLVDAVLDSEMTKVDVVLGDSTAASAEAARRADAARAGADEAAARAAGDAARVEDLKRVTRDVAAGAALAAERAEDSKRGAEAAAVDAVADAKLAEGAAEEAEVSCEAAEAAAKQAGARAAEAEASAKVAADAVSDALGARDGAQAAQRGAEAAQVVAEDASEQAGRYAEQAEGAADGAVVAQGKAEAAQRKAEQEASKAEQNAALLGDAALKGGDNTFTGANVFNGAISGNGTLYGMQMQHWLGKAAILSGYTVMSENMIKKVFPEHATMTVLPPFDWGDMPNYNIKNLFPNLEYVYCEMDKGTGQWTRGVPNAFTHPKIKEYWLKERGAGVWHVCHKFMWNSYLFFPYWKNNPLVLIMQGFKTDGRYNSCKVYVPLEPEVSIGIEHYGGTYILSEFEFLGANTIKKFKIYNSRTQMRLINGVFPSCTNLTVANTILLERESLLALIGSLPAYDAATMTAIPTASVYVNPEYQGDEEITAALMNLQTAVEDGGKGWTVAITGISLGGAATFALRTMYYYARREDADGSYIDADGQRWDVSGGTTVLRNYEANEQVPGYAAFLSLEDALEQWGLHEITPEESKADYERRHGKD